MDKNTIIQMLSILPFENSIETKVESQTGDDLITQLFNAHERFKADYDLLTNNFFSKNYFNELWKLFKMFQFNAEPGEAQTMRSPYVILSSKSVDCKHYALFCGGILGSLKRKGYNIDWFYRFASYTNDPPATHVYVVVNSKFGEIWIDPVFDSEFDQQSKTPVLVVDKKTNDKMAIYQLSGPTAAQSQLGKVAVDKNIAESNFLVLINLDSPKFPIKSLLLRNISITDGSFKNWYIAQGFDYQNLLNILLA